MSKVIKNVQSPSIFKEYYVLLIYLFYGFIVFAPFLSGRQRVHDSYLVEIYAGYGFMINGLFNQGRVFSSLLYQALLFLNPPFNLAMAISTGVSIVFLSIAAYIMFYLTKKYAVPSDCRNRDILATIGSLLVFFNLFILESMLFFESAIMSLGILLAVIACALFLRGGIKWYVISLICMILSMFCYQPSSAFFPPLVVLFLGANHQEQISRLIKKIFIAALIHGGALFSNFIFLQIFSYDARFDGEVRIIENISFSINAIVRFGLNHMGFMPNYVFSLFLFVFFCIIIYVCYWQKKPTGFVTILMSFVAIFAATFVLMLPMSTDIWYILPRNGVAMAGIGGMMLLGIVLYSKRVSRIVLAIATVFLLIVSQIQIDIQLNSRANNHLDMLELALIGERLRAYENYRGSPIERIYFGYDSPKTWFRPQLNNYHDLTISMWHVGWMPRPFIWHYLGREVSMRPMSSYDIERIAYARKEHWFTGGRMVFDDGVVYLILNNITTIP
ncbi:MAG: glucosyltransferase domain-containing protein [Defluviitaleaceae bacterium]|nr:glucosyltransferase domain-containing protein [Defluviitaleaceae bacterium]MCL2263742.1 glucosyltransferase domain-containing protein [Defluviitaleaceae bacterium]